MNICMLSAFYYPITAGSEVFTQEISERLVKDGHEVHVITGSWLKLKWRENINGVHVHRVPSLLIPYLSLPSTIPGMSLAALSRKCDIIHAHLAFPSGFVGALLKNITDTPLITTVQGGDLGIYPHSGIGRLFPLVSPLISYALRNSDCITAISGYLKKRAIDLGGKNVKLVRNGTDTKKFKPGVRAKTLTEKYTLGGHPRLLTVSRLVPKNGVHHLIAAFFHILRDFPNASLLIAGDGPERKSLQKQVRDLGLSEHVNFLGYVDHNEIPYLMNASDLFIRTSLEEGLGIVFTEAMACGKPVIATNVGGIPDVVIDGKTGILVEPGDIAGIAEAIKKILSSPPLLRSIRRESLELVKKEFSWDAIYKKMLRIYSETAR